MGEDATGSEPVMTDEVVRTARDPEQLRAGLAAWLATKKPGAEVTRVEVPSSNGMSSETVLLDASWDEGGSPVAQRLVARIAPEDAAVPVFPAYDLDKQARVMTDARAAAPSVPIPVVVLNEPDPGPLGTPFFVMERVDGRVPPDVMPYNFDSWVSAATPTERELLQTSSLGAMAALHAVDDAHSRFAYLEVDRPGATAMRRQLADQAAYYDWAREGLHVPIIDRTFAWLEDRFPADEGDAGLCWGDARIGNVLFAADGFEPVAVLDWEMAVLAPPEVDLAWFAYIHTFFEDLAGVFGVPGLPDFLRIDDCAATYERLSGRTPRHLDWFTVYAALRYAIVSIRTTKRRVHFEGIPFPEDLDDLVMHKDGLERLLAG
jgi:aminoglycoside phosphotransferase (APT) family kinase protein